MTGRMLDDRLGKMRFWLTFIGFHTTFLVQYWLGDMDMPRRYADYLQSNWFTTLNTVSTIGAFILGTSELPFIWKSYRFGAVTVDDPVASPTPSHGPHRPPPLRNFERLPRMRSARPAFDATYGGDLADLARDVPHRETRPARQM